MTAPLLPRRQPNLRMRHRLSPDIPRQSARQLPYTNRLRARVRRPQGGRVAIPPRRREEREEPVVTLRVLGVLAVGMVVDHL